VKLVGEQLAGERSAGGKFLLIAVGLGHGYYNSILLMLT
jgi:hypothetical protein